MEDFLAGSVEEAGSGTEWWRMGGSGMVDEKWMIDCSDVNAEVRASDTVVLIERRFVLHDEPQEKERGRMYYSNDSPIPLMGATS